MYFIDMIENEFYKIARLVKSYYIITLDCAYSLNSLLPITNSVISCVVSIWFWYFWIFWTISFNLGSDVGLKPVLSNAYEFGNIQITLLNDLVNT